MTQYESEEIVTNQHAFTCKPALIKILGEAKTKGIGCSPDTSFSTGVYRIHSNIQGSYISRKASLKDFHGLFFADHQVEYIVSLSHCFFSRIKILCSASLQ